MNKSLRERQLKKQVLELLKSKAKPIYLRAIAQHLEFLHGEELGEFWTLKLQETVEALLKEGVLLEVRIRNFKAYKHADPAPDSTQPAPAVAAATTTYRFNYKTNYVPPRDTPARAGAMAHQQCKSFGARC